MEHGGVAEKLRWALVVTSESVKRGIKEDKVSPLVESLLREQGYELVCKYVVGNSAAEVQYRVLEAIVVHHADVVLVTGGTGPSPRDVSLEAVRQLSSKELPGIGELFRAESYKEIGARAYLSRASAFVVHGSLVVVSPGSPSAVKVMLEKVLIPLVGHLVYELRRR